ncbi:hypothetical protein CVT24_002001 [Panaeolus cyanescens]|uniref:Mediator complex subunit 18 n=1 Tax=Panaeolus cyanescens TaxID=181874 RepID=A0A409YHI8_9AGAR|nr:hypothetical protein CVT24_002001 [Panaeolus cyanescens]
MTSHFYEVALFGEFFLQDLKPILNRITLHSDSSQPFHSREFLFEPIDAQQQRDSGTEPILLRAKRELTDPKAPWELFSYLKPESVRVYPEATVRPWATCQVIGDALSFAAALGYVYVDPKTQQPIPAHADTLWEVEVKTTKPIKNDAETPISRAIEAILEIQLLMKGLLDLRRQDV